MDDSPKIKVTDRRLFTPDGQLRDESEPTAEAEEQPSAPGPESARAPEPSSAGEASRSRAPDSASSIENAAGGSAVEWGAPEGAGPAGSGAGPGSQGGPISFFDLVGLLAEPVALYLGDLALPNGERQVDLDQARLHIDLLGVLEEKTRGNLSQEEEAVLSDLVYRLKMRYVQKREGG